MGNVALVALDKDKIQRQREAINKILDPEEKERKLARLERK